MTLESVAVVRESPMVEVRMTRKVVPCEALFIQGLAAFQNMHGVQERGNVGK